MIMRYPSMAILCLIVVWTSFGQRWVVPVREIVNTDIPDLAIAGYDQFGPVIYFNPTNPLASNSDFMAFTRAHEYAHHYLNHLRRESVEANPFNRNWVNKGCELEADCYAAMVLSDNPALLARVADLFLRVQGYTSPDPDHPTGVERADNIRNCPGAAHTSRKLAIEEAVLHTALQELLSKAHTDYASLKGANLVSTNDGRYQKEEKWSVAYELPDGKDFELELLDQTYGARAGKTWKYSNEWEFGDLGLAQIRFTALRSVLDSTFRKRQ
jgi:hypothetical protein